MAKKKKKYYVVWSGHKTGVFTTWAECSKQVKGYQQAEYKAFDSLEDARRAYKGKYSDYVTRSGKSKSSHSLPKGVLKDTYCVDAACSGNPGDLEYRCVHVGTKKEMFRRGPYKSGTNNVGEFLALVDALATLKKEGISKPIYSDSKIAMIWVRKKHCKTKLRKNEANERLFDLIERAEKWLIENHYENKILKWETRAWGEIPADYGRK